MRTRNAGTPKPPATQKKTPPLTKKAGAVKTPSPSVKTPPSTAKTSTSASTPPSTVAESTPELVTPTSAVTPATEPEATPVSDPISQSPVEQQNASTEDAAAAVPTKAVAGAKKKVTRTKKVIKKVLRPKVPSAAKAVPTAPPKEEEAENVKGDEGQKDDNVTDLKDEKDPEAEEVVKKITESEEQEEPVIQRADDIGDAQEEKVERKMDVDDLPTTDSRITTETESPVTEVLTKSADELSESIKGNEEVNCGEHIEEVNADAEVLESQQESEDQPENMDGVPEPENMEDKKPENMEDKKPESMDDGQIEKGDDAAQLKENDALMSEGMDDYGDEEGFVEPGEEDLRDDDDPETIDDMKVLTEENKELTAAAAKERKIKKEHEIFVGGLDSEVVEEDLKMAFEKVGEVVEVRLLKDSCTNKNRGCGFVRFATKDQAKKALSEMKNPVISGKRCGTAASEDNDTLFVGNICNTWTKEAINKKLKEYNLEGVENITLVQDPRHEGLSRGFCFIQFACHDDAMLAFKRLQKPDVVFGHAERTAKVAFSEPLQEPDPEIMAKVKSVFIDGLPPYWDEDRVRKHFQSYGEIERVTLARNMPAAKRKDFGFVDFLTHEAAIACIEDINRKDLVDGNSKIKVRARLSNPLPKMQAVKGGMRGGFRIARPVGRSLGRPGPVINRPNFQYGRVPRGSFNDPIGPYVRRHPHRGGHRAPGPSLPVRDNFGGPRHGFIERGPVRPIPPYREPFPLDDGGFSRPFMGRPYDDPYMYDDNHGLKRPFHMIDQGPAYMDPSRVRPRFDYTGSGRGSHVRDTFDAGSSMYSSGYYGDYGARPHSSFNVRDRSYGRGRGGGGSGSGSGGGYYY